MSFNNEELDLNDENELNAFFDQLARIFKDAPKVTYTSIISKEKVEALKKAAEAIKKTLVYPARVSVTPYSEDTELGLIKIRSKNIIVFNPPSVLSKIGRSGVGIDFSSYLDGTTEVAISFHTTERVGETVESI